MSGHGVGSSPLEGSLLHHVRAPQGRLLWVAARWGALRFSDGASYDCLDYEWGEGSNLIYSRPKDHGRIRPIQICACKGARHYSLGGVVDTRPHSQYEAVAWVWQPLPKAIKCWCWTPWGLGGSRWPSSRWSFPHAPRRRGRWVHPTSRKVGKLTFIKCVSPGECVIHGTLSGGCHFAEGHYLLVQACSNVWLAAFARPWNEVI